MRSSGCARRSRRIRCRKNVSFAQGAAIGTPYATAYRGLLQRAVAKPGETVLVHGASGGVGTAAVQLARAHGLCVLGTAGSDDGMKLARQQGAHEVFDHRAPDHFWQIMKATGGHGVDVIVEMLANVNLGKDLRLISVAYHFRALMAPRRRRPILWPHLASSPQILRRRVDRVPCLPSGV